MLEFNPNLDIPVTQVIQTEIEIVSKEVFNDASNSLRNFKQSLSVPIGGIDSGAKLSGITPIAIGGNNLFNKLLDVIKGVGYRGKIGSLGTGATSLSKTLINNKNIRAELKQTRQILDFNNTIQKTLSNKLDKLDSLNKTLITESKRKIKNLRQQIYYRNKKIERIQNVQEIEKMRTLYEFKNMKMQIKTFEQYKAQTENVKFNPENNPTLQTIKTFEQNIIIPVKDLTHFKETNR